MRETHSSSGQSVCDGVCEALKYVPKLQLWWIKEQSSKREADFKVKVGEKPLLVLGSAASEVPLEFHISRLNETFKENKLLVCVWCVCSGKLPSLFIF